VAYDSPLMSRFDLPAVTRPATDVCHERDCRIPVAEPLPALVAPTLMPPVLHPADEPLMPVEHPRLATYGNYAAAGWTHAYPTTLLRRAVFDRLVAAAESLPAPWGIGVFDGWRPLSLQIELFQAAYCDPSVPPGFVAEPSTEPTEPPPHLTGGTVDCTLTYDGIALALGCGFDDFTARAHTDALENEPGVDRDLRRLLYWTMHSAGFVVLDCEWWHFEYGTRRWAALTCNDPLYGAVEPSL
jgi:D-alanyl-D-alanine dipeptidase